MDKRKIDPPELFSGAVYAATELHQKLQAGLSDGHLSAEPLLRKALVNGNTSVERLRTLAQRLRDAPSRSHARIDHFLENVQAYSRRMSSRANASPPIESLHRFVPIRREFIALLAELGKFRTTAQEVVALGVLQAAEQKRQKALTKRYHRYLEAVRTRTQHYDLVRHQKADRADYWTYRWEGADTGIPIDDPASLISWIASRREL